MPLSPPYKDLDYFCRKLKKDGFITSCIASHAHIKIKHGERFLKINHVSDLKKVLPQMIFEPFKKIN